MNRFIFYLGFLLSVMTTLPVNGQRTVTGRLVDPETGKPVKGGTIFLPEKNLKAVSNSLGYFQLQADSSAIIEVAGDGYSTIKVKLPVGNHFRIELKKISVNSDQDHKEFKVYEELPTFPGGMQNFVKYIHENIKLPREVRYGTVSGKVQVEFVIDSLGQIPPNKIKISQGLCKLCDEEAVRLIRESPKWNPAIQRDKPVNVMMHLPITFK